MADTDYIAINRANWDERAPEHAKAPSYNYQRFIDEPNYLSSVVRFDIPLLGDITGLKVAHLQCHIGTDTLSLARRGAASVVGLDVSPESLAQARRLTASAAGGEKVRFVEGDLYSAPELLKGEMFDLVFTGIGALCWLPDIKRWAETVAALLKPGGQLFIREGHPILWSLDDQIRDKLILRYPYFETKEPMVFEQDNTYVKLADDSKSFKATKTIEWNHGIGEIVSAVLSAGMRLTGLVEHQSIPWLALRDHMVDLGDEEYAMKEGREVLPLSYTLQAVKE